MMAKTRSAWRPSRCACGLDARSLLKALYFGLLNNYSELQCSICWNDGRREHGGGHQLTRSKFAAEIRIPLAISGLAMPMKKILVVEDAEFNRDLLVQLLEDDYEVITAENGAEAVDLAHRVRPDLILMDLSLPVVDGWEATRRIKADQALRHIPVIALTAHAMQGDEEKARASGCDEYITKPIDEGLLFDTLRRYVGADT